MPYTEKQWKTWEINIKLVNNEKDYWNYLSQKIFQDNLVAIQKKLTLIKT